MNAVLHTGWHVPGAGMNVYGGLQNWVDDFFQQLIAADCTAGGGRA